MGRDNFQRLAGEYCHTSAFEAVKIVMAKGEHFQMRRLSKLCNPPSGLLSIKLCARHILCTKPLRLPSRRTVIVQFPFDEPKGFKSLWEVRSKQVGVQHERALAMCSLALG